MVHQLCLLLWAAVPRAAAVSAVAELDRGAGEGLVGVAGDDVIAAPTAAAEELRALLREVIYDGQPSAGVLVNSSSDKAWHAEHGAELLALVQQMQQAWGGVKRLSASRQPAKSDMEPAERGTVLASRSEFLEMRIIDAAGTNDTNTKAPKEDPEPRSEIFLIAMGVSWVISLIIIYITWEHLNFDLFSMEIVSRAEVVAFFTIFAMSMYYSLTRAITDLVANKLLVYALQFVACLMTTTIMITVWSGCVRDQPAFVVTLATVQQLLYFGGSIAGSALQLDAAVFGLIKTCLVGVVAITMWHKVFLAYGCGDTIGAYTSTWYQKFHLEREEFLRRRKAGEDASQSVSVPIVLLAGIACVMTWSTVVAISGFSIVFYVLPEFSEEIGTVLDRSRELFVLAEIEMPANNHDWAMEFVWKIQVSATVALIVSFMYVGFVCHMAVTGYRKICYAMVAGKPYKGAATFRDQQQHEAYHPFWGTYFAGGLLGNCAAGYAFFSTLIFIFVFVSQFPALVALLFRILAPKAVLPFCVFVTRTIVYKLYILKNVCLPDGTMIRPGIWDFIYPTMTMLSLILGILSGIIRIGVMFGFMMGRLFRIDVTPLSEDLMHMDWAYHAFISLALNGSKRLKTAMEAADSVEALFAEPAAISNTSSKEDVELSSIGDQLKGQSKAEPPETEGKGGLVNQQV